MVYTYMYIYIYIYIILISHDITRICQLDLNYVCAYIWSWGWYEDHHEHDVGLPSPFHDYTFWGKFYNDLTVLPGIIVIRLSL